MKLCYKTNWSLLQAQQPRWRLFILPSLRRCGNVTAKYSMSNLLPWKSCSKEGPNTDSSPNSFIGQPPPLKKVDSLIREVEEVPSSRSQLPLLSSRMHLLETLWNWRLRSQGSFTKNGIDSRKASEVELFDKYDGIKLEKEGRTLDCNWSSLRLYNHCYCNWVLLLFEEILRQSSFSLKTAGSLKLKLLCGNA